MIHQQKNIRISIVIISWNFHRLMKLMEILIIIENVDYKNIKKDQKSLLDRYFGCFQLIIL